MSAIIPFIEGCFIISHDATIHPMRCRAGGGAGCRTTPAWSAVADGGGGCAGVSGNTEMR